MNIRTESIYGDPLQIIKENGGYYESPVKDGKRIGPMTTYAGIAPDGKNYVGYIYFDIARIESRYSVRRFLSQESTRSIVDAIGYPEAIVSAPMGGMNFGITVANYLEADSVFFEKKVTVLEDKKNGVKEKSELVFKRHLLSKGDHVVIYEDVCNNFSSTDQMINVLQSIGVSVVGIACIINRSDTLVYRGVPVISVIQKKIPQYSQDSEEVQQFLANGGEICTDAKGNWNRLLSFMRK